MSLVLSLETSGSVCSVAIHQQGRLLSLKELKEPQAHASRLAILIQEILVEVKMEPEALDAVAISSGPGSYTGLRIGTSTAKGLCFSLSIPLVAINSLELLIAKARAKNSGTWLCPMIDARRMEVYCKLVDQNLKPIHGIEARVIDEQSYASYLKDNKITFFGDGAAKCAEVINSKNAVFVSGEYPSAKELGDLAFEKLSKGQTEDVVNFEPYYLKEFLVKKSAKSLL